MRSVHEPALTAGGKTRLLGDRDSSLYVIGQITSMLGDSALWLAMGIWVMSLTGSSAAAALVWMAFLLGGLSGPVTSVLVDRLPLRPLLVGVNLAGAADVLLLLFVRGESEVWLVYPVMVFYGVVNSLLNAGSSALVRPMVGTELLPRINAVLATAKQGMNLVAPVLGAGLFAVSGATPVIIADAATFVLAAATLALIRFRAERSGDDTARPGAWLTLSAGVRHLMTTAPLRRVAVACAVAILGLGFLSPVEYSVNSIGLNRAPEFIGVLFTAQGVGALFGGVCAPKVIRLLGELRTVATALVAAAAGIALMAVPALPIVLLAFALYGAALPWVAVAQQTQLQRLTPLDMQGRTAGAAGLLTRTPQACGIAIGSLAIDAVGYRTLIGAIAVLTCVAAVWLFLSGAKQARRHGDGDIEGTM
ncbi:MFS transporter [Amycolatopsis sp. NPDC054798]